MNYKFTKGDAVIVTDGQAKGLKGTITGIQTAANKYPYYVMLPGQTISHLYGEHELALDFTNVPPAENKESISATWAIVILCIILTIGIYAVALQVSSHDNRSEQKAEILSDTVARIPD